jgi:cardiolipin-specific phospholipase
MPRQALLADVTLGMDVQGGHDSVKALAKVGNHAGRVFVVKNAGHHVYLDNPDDTNRIIDRAVKGVKVGEVEA